MYYLIHVERFNDGHAEARSLFAYETFDEALSQMYGHQKAGIDTENVAMAMNGILTDGGVVMRMERWAEPEPTPDPEVTA